MCNSACHPRKDVALLASSFMKQHMVVRDWFLLKGAKEICIFVSSKKNFCISGNASEAKALKRRGSPQNKKNVDAWIVNTCLLIRE
jgi:hypothetical protein